MGLSTGAYMAIAGGSMAAATIYSANKAGKQAAPPPSTVMPTMSDDAVKNAKRRQIAEMQARSGRASTMLSDPAARLGG